MRVPAGTVSVSAGTFDGESDEAEASCVCGDDACAGGCVIGPCWSCARKMPAFVIIIAIARRPDIFRMLLLRFGGFPVHPALCCPPTMQFRPLRMPCMDATDADFDAARAPA